MSTTQLDTTDILADLESYFADPPATHTRTLEQQAQCYMLLWEVHGIVKIVSATRQSPNTTNGLRRLRNIAYSLLELLGGNDTALDLAKDMVAEMPWGAPLQAILTNRAGHFVDEREFRAGVQHGD